ncbi:MAG TPA: alpha/beta hydrolase domain-containing protein, partial [Acidimicrobiales bacterium]|nr:alpha/beta hydrolase domain-containing protein [Acidimicrobiales bacterium]
MTETTLTAFPGSGRPFVAGTRFSLGALGYQAAEYAFGGRAAAYGPSGRGVKVVEEADFATRLLVYRPSDPAGFNGTVWVEWLNVSGGLDAAPDWIFSHTELMRRGAAWVGVSAQKIGVEGGGSLIGLPSRGLVGIDPERYGGLSHPGDRFSYDIFRAAGAAARHGSLLPGLDVRRVLGMGQSQSAFRLTSYVNRIDPLTPVYDGFLIHARGRAAAPLDDEEEVAVSLRGGPVAFRSDLRVPVLCVSSETDLMTLGYLEARQDDHETLVSWEMAGTAHGDMYTFVVGPVDTGQLPLEELAAGWVPVSEVYG